MSQGEPGIELDTSLGYMLKAAASALHSAMEAVLRPLRDANAFESTVPYPRFFTRREVLAYDLFLLLVIAAGAAFAVGAVVLARRSRFPRTDAMGGALCGAVLLVLGSALLFTRLIAIIRG